MAVAVRIAKVAISIWLATLVSVVAVPLLWQRNAPLPEAADAIVCLGAGMLNGQSSLPGPVSARRAETCAKLHIEGVAPIVIFTGYGHARGTVADAMAGLAHQRGVPTSAILVEPVARSTLQNAAFSKEYLPDGSDRVVLVSDAFHLPRSWLIFRMLGYAEVDLFAAERSTSASFSEDIKGDIWWNVRESIVIWVNVGRAIVYWGAGFFGVDPAVRIGWFN